MCVEQYVSGSCQTLNSPLCKRHEPNASNSRGLISLQLFSVDHVNIVITVALNIQRYMLNLILINE